MRWVITGSNNSKQSATKSVGMVPRAQYFLAEAITSDRASSSVSLRKELKGKPSSARSRSFAGSR